MCHTSVNVKFKLSCTVYEKSISVWNQTQDLQYYTNVNNPSNNYAYGKLVICHTTNELLFDTYINNELLYGMPSVVVFYYQLHNLLFHHHFHLHYCLFVICICYIGRLEQHHNSNMLPTYVATKNQTN